MRRRVVVTGIGMVTPLGNSVEETWEGMRHGRSGVDRITRFDASTFPTKIAGEVKQFDLSRFVERPERFQYSGPNSRFALAAAQMAMRDSRIDLGGIDHSRLGVYLGSGEGQQDFETFMGVLSHAFHDGH